MKAVLIIDVPDNILLGFSKANIEIKENAYLVNKDENKWKYTKPIKIEGIPLKPLPQKREVEVNEIKDIMHTEFQTTDVITDKFIADIKFETDKLIALGYNSCIDDIMG